MSRITHAKIQPKNIMYWDYYVLCHLDCTAALALQRMEYWDGTKEDGNVHSEAYNDALEAVGESSTQDTSRWVYKSQEELKWELMNMCSLRTLPGLIDTLIEDLHYLEKQSNPTIAFDRKKQYRFCDALVQDHVSYLGYILEYFKRAGHHMNTVYYAIEQLTAEEVYIDTLGINGVYGKLLLLKQQSEEDDQILRMNNKYRPQVPKFIRISLKKDRKLLENIAKLAPFPLPLFAEWIQQNVVMHSAESKDALQRKGGSNSSNYKQVTTDNKNKLPTQLPSGNMLGEKVSSFSSSSSKGTNPSSTDKNPRGKKAAPLPASQVAVLDQWDSLVGCPVDRSTANTKKAASYLAGCIASGSATLQDIERVRTRMLTLPKNPYYRDNGLTLPLFASQFSTQLSALKLTHLAPATAEAEAEIEDEMTAWIRSRTIHSGPVEVGA